MITSYKRLPSILSSSVLRSSTHPAQQPKHQNPLKSEETLPDYRTQAPTPQLASEPLWSQPVSSAYFPSPKTHTHSPLLPHHTFPPFPAPPTPIIHHRSVPFPIPWPGLFLPLGISFPHNFCYWPAPRSPPQRLLRDVIRSSAHRCASLGLAGQRHR